MTKAVVIVRFVLASFTILAFIGLVLLTNAVIDPAMKKINLKLGKEILNG